MEFFNDYTWAEVVIVSLLGSIAFLLWTISGWCGDMYRKLDGLLKLRDIEVKLGDIEEKIEKIRWDADEIKDSVKDINLKD